MCLSLKIEIRYGEKCGYIDSLWVHDDFQKLSIVKTLKMKGENWARERGHGFIATDVDYSNKRLSVYFKYSEPIRRIIYTTNIIEGLHR